MLGFGKKKKSEEEEVKKILKSGLADIVNQAYSEGITARGNGRSILGQLFGGSKDNSRDYYKPAYTFDRDNLQAKSIDAYFTNPRAKSAVTRIVESSISDGLKLECKPAWDIIETDLDDEAKEVFTKRVEKFFHLWANTKAFDVEGRSNFYDMQRSLSIRTKLQGEVFIFVKYGTKNKDSVIPVQFQLIDASRIANPMAKTEIAKGHKLIDGIEYNSSGEEVAYYYLKDNPNDAIFGTRETIRVPKVGPRSGKRYMIHCMNDETAMFNRGIPLLTGVIHELQKISDYSVAEIQAAVVNASIVGWLKPSDVKDSSKPFTAVGVSRKTSGEALAELGGTSDPQRFQFGDAGAFIQNLKAGEEIHSYDTKRPNINFGVFVDQVMQGVSASLGIPLTVLNQKFTDNYSASRAELLLFWNTIRQDRSRIERDVLREVYDIFFEAIVESGRVKIENYQSLDLYSKLAWKNCSWIGLALPSIDPLKEARAVTERLEQGTTTRDRESAIFNGSNYDDNVQTLTRENAKLYEANKLLEAFTQIVDYVDKDEEPANPEEKKEGKLKEGG